MSPQSGLGSLKELLEMKGNLNRRPMHIKDSFASYVAPSIDG